LRQIAVIDEMMLGQPNAVDTQRLGADSEVDGPPVVLGP
jgi:hypothetical protein